MADSIKYAEDDTTRFASDGTAVGTSALGMYLLGQVAMHRTNLGPGARGVIAGLGEGVIAAIAMKKLPRFAIGTVASAFITIGQGLLDEFNLHALRSAPAGQQAVVGAATSTTPVAAPASAPAAGLSDGRPGSVIALGSRLNKCMPVVP